MNHPSTTSDQLSMLNLCWAQLDLHLQCTTCRSFLRGCQRRHREIRLLPGNGGKETSTVLRCWGFVMQWLVEWWVMLSMVDSWLIMVCWYVLASRQLADKDLQGVWRFRTWWKIPSILGEGSQYIGVIFTERVWGHNLTHIWSPECDTFM